MKFFPIKVNSNVFGKESMMFMLSQMDGSHDIVDGGIKVDTGCCDCVENNDANIFIFEIAEGA